jgi:hypothetical protein
MKPTADYWVNDQLVWDGTSTGAGNCYAATPGSAGAGTCPAGVWMKVVWGTAADAYGNTSLWADCGLNALTPDEYFGGCNATAGITPPNDSGTAGALCCD